MNYFRCGGGGSEKTLVLPDNTVAINVFSNEKSVTIMWDIPQDSEAVIEKFNIYYCKSDTKPVSLNEFTLYKTVEPTVNTCVIENLGNDTNYYIVVCSVTTDDYENASLRGVENGIPRKAEIVIAGYHTCASSEDGLNWDKMTNDSISKIEWVNDRWIQPTIDNSKIYYSFNKINWIVATFDSSLYYSKTDVLPHIEYSKGIYYILLGKICTSSTETRQGKIVTTRDFINYTEHEINYYFSGASILANEFAVINKFIVVATKDSNNSANYGYIDIYDTEFNKINSVKVIATASNLYSSYVFVQSHSYGAYIIMFQNLYYFNGVTGTLTLIFTFESSNYAYSTFRDGEKIYISRYSDTWLQIDIGSMEVVDTGITPSGFPSQIIGIASTKNRWVARNKSDRSAVYYSGKDLGNWIYQNTNGYYDYSIAKKGERIVSKY